MSDGTSVLIVPNPNPDAIGKRVRMKFEISGIDTWFLQVIATYDAIKAKFSSHVIKKIVYVSLDDEDFEFLE